MKIVFIRHSKTIKDRTRKNVLWGLSDEGIELAKNLSQNQVIKDIEVLYSTLQTKALETSLYLTKPNAIPIKTDNNFAEISSFTKKILGAEEYEKAVHDFYTGLIERIEEGESLKEAQERFLKGLEKIVEEEQKNSISNLGIVSHGTILAAFSSLYSDFTPYELHKKIKMPDIAVFNWNTKTFEIFWGEVL